jgi:hypothetical protein
MRPIISIDNGSSAEAVRYPVTPCIEPLKCLITRSDLYADSTGRSAETGRLLQYPVREGIYSIDLEYLGTDTEIKDMERLISGTQLTVHFLYNGDEVTAIMYPSDRVNETEKILNNQGRHRLSFTLVEV